MPTQNIEKTQRSTIYVQCQRLAESLEMQDTNPLVSKVLCFECSSVHPYLLPQCYASLLKNPLQASYEPPNKYSALNNNMSVFFSFMPFWAVHPSVRSILLNAMCQEPLEGIFFKYVTNVHLVSRRK